MPASSVKPTCAGASLHNHRRKPQKQPVPSEYFFRSNHGHQRPPNVPIQFILIIPHLTSLCKHKTLHSTPSMLDAKDTIMSKTFPQGTLGPVGESEMTTPKSHYYTINAFILIGTKYSSVTKEKTTLGGVTESFREQKALLR